MRRIHVVRITYSTVFAVGRTVRIPLGDRAVELRIRPCTEDPMDGLRLSITTNTSQNLPRKRLAEGFAIQTRPLRGGPLHAITIMPAHGNASLPSLATLADQPQKASAELLDFLDQVLPEYRFE